MSETRAQAMKLSQRAADFWAIKAARLQDEANTAMEFYHQAQAEANRISVAHLADPNELLVAAQRMQRALHTGKSGVK